MFRFLDFLGWVFLVPNLIFLESRLEKLKENLAVDFRKLCILLPKDFKYLDLINIFKYDGLFNMQLIISSNDNIACY